MNANPLQQRFQPIFDELHEDNYISWEAMGAILDFVEQEKELTRKETEEKYANR